MIHSHSTHGNTPSGPYDARQITLRSVSRLFCEPEARARSKRLIFIFIPLGNTYTGQVLLCIFTIHNCSGISGIKRPGLDQVPAHLFPSMTYQQDGGSYGDLSCLPTENRRASKAVRGSMLHAYSFSESLVMRYYQRTNIQQLEESESKERTGSQR